MLSPRRRTNKVTHLYDNLVAPGAVDLALRALSSVGRATDF
jgi:hypothetical protein